MPDNRITIETIVNKPINEVWEKYTVPVYDEVVKNKKIVYTLGDGRRVVVEFNVLDGRVKIVTTFEAEQSNPLDMQKAGWQAILDNFKKYVDNN